MILMFDLDWDYVVCLWDELDGEACVSDCVRKPIIMIVERNRTEQKEGGGGYMRIYALDKHIEIVVRRKKGINRDGVTYLETTM